MFPPLSRQHAAPGHEQGWRCLLLVERTSPPARGLQAAQRTQQGKGKESDTGSSYETSTNTGVIHISSPLLQGGVFLDGLIFRFFIFSCQHPCANSDSFGNFSLWPHTAHSMSRCTCRVVQKRQCNAPDACKPVGPTAKVLHPKPGWTVRRWKEIV